MTDVVAVALISSGASLLGASVGALTTYKVNLRNTEATIATTENQRKVELARIEAENQRLRDGNREEERRNRQATYHKHLNATMSLYQILGFEASTEQRKEAREDFRYLHAGVVLFGPPPVRGAAIELAMVNNEFWNAFIDLQQNHPDGAPSELWRDATAVFQEPFGKKLAALVDAMHADVTHGVMPEHNAD